MMTKILLISADNSLTKAITGCLKQAGYVVITTPRGVGAIQLIHRENPDLIVLDVDLPDFNSLAIIRLLRAEQNSQRVPLVLMGMNMREEDALIGWEAGADLCLLEVFHPQVFVARLRSLLRRSVAQPVK